MQKDKIERSLTFSVIVPMGSPAAHLDELRRSVGRRKTIELIIVAPVQDKTYWQNRIDASEQWIFTDRAGRGRFLYEGARRAAGDILLFLHADTVLPPNWDHLIKNALRDDRISGGGFSLSFDRGHLFLSLLIGLSDLFFYLRKELWGDRALFVRAELLRPHLFRIDVPLMEDILLSGIIRRGGKMILLPEKVTTSAHHFYQRGFIRHTLLILYCRLMYAMGTNEETLYDWYYPQKEGASGEPQAGKIPASSVIVKEVTRRRQGPKTNRPG